MRAAPQLSVAVSAPHRAFALAQNATSPSYVQPHWFAPAPPPPQVWPVPTHAPHEGTVLIAPQLSGPDSTPHRAPAFAQNVAFDSGAQPQRLPASAPQLCPPPVQVPQPTVRCVPQLSWAETDPQSAPALAQSATSPS